MRCFVKNCPNDNGSGSQGVSYFTFPKNLKLMEKWKQFCMCEIDNFKVARICSDHFKEDDIANSLKYKMGFSMKRALKPNAVPSILPIATTTTGSSMLYMNLALKPPAPIKSETISAADTKEYIDKATSTVGTALEIELLESRAKTAELQKECQLLRQKQKKILKKHQQLQKECHTMQQNNKKLSKTVIKLQKDCHFLKRENANIKKILPRDRFQST